MTKGLLAGGGVLLALVVGLSIWIGSLRGQVRDSEQLLAEVTRQRDEATGRARSLSAKSTALGEQMEAKNVALRDATERGDNLDAELREWKAAAGALTTPVGFTDCMANLTTVTQYNGLLEERLQMSRLELAAANDALFLRAQQVYVLTEAVDQYETALRLDDARFEGQRAVEKKRRKKRILGFTLGSVALVGAGIGGGYALAKR